MSRTLKAVADLHPDQYLTHGGVPAAIDRVATLLKEGYGWTFEIDIANCFPSFAGTNLEKIIPVKKEVIANVIMAEHLNVIPGHNLLYHFGPAVAGEDDPGDPVAFSEALANARRGIPQGSAVASIAAEMLLAGPLKSLPDDARVVCYADNMLILAKSEAGAVSICNILWSALKAHPVGHLQPKIKSHSKTKEAFDFLGHRIKQVGTSVSIVPTPENTAAFDKRLRKGLATITNAACSGKWRKTVAEELKSYISSWTSNFSRCTGIEDRKKQCIAKVHHALAAACSKSALAPGAPNVIGTINIAAETTKLQKQSSLPIETEVSTKEVLDAGVESGVGETASPEQPGQASSALSATKLPAYDSHIQPPKKNIIVSKSDVAKMRAAVTALAATFCAAKMAAASG